MLPVLWRIPYLGLPIHGYGVMLFIAFILCTWMAGRRGEKEGISRETIQDLAIWLFVGGLLGARLTYILSQPKVPSLVDILISLPKIWDGGLVLYGSILGGLASYALAYFLIFRKRGLSTLRLVDVVAPALAVGICLGRVGCFLNGCCFGGVACASCAALPVSFPAPAPPRYALVERGWQTAAGFTLPEISERSDSGVKIGKVEPNSTAYQAGLREGDVIVGVNGTPVQGRSDLDKILEDWPRSQLTMNVEYRSGGQGEPKMASFKPWSLGLYPTQLYESVSMLLLLLVLLAYYPLRHQTGQVMAVMMVGYGLHRYLNEILRIDTRPEGLERYTSALVVALGVGFWLWRQFTPRPGETPAQKPQAETSGATT
jgi:phosphatidylglycerol:prolipoprotein diacylglycerol transferase